MAKYGTYRGFGTWKLEVDGDLFYFSSMADMKAWFKRFVKNVVMEMLKNTLKVLLNYIPTESGQLAEAVYTASQYAVVDWKDQIICKVKVVDPKFYVFVKTDGQSKSKKIMNTAHSHSQHKAYRAPAVNLVNPLVHLIGTKGKGYIYLRDDPLATTNYLTIMRRFIRDMIATAMSRIMRKSYYVHYYIKVSKTQYGKDLYLNPTAPAIQRSQSVATLQKLSNTNPQPIDEFGTFLTLYNQL